METHEIEYDIHYQPQHIREVFKQQKTDAFKDVVDEIQQSKSFENGFQNIVSKNKIQIMDFAPVDIETF